MLYLTAETDVNGVAQEPASSDGLRLPAPMSRPHHGKAQPAPGFVLLGHVSARFGDSTVSLGPPQQQAIMVALLLQNGSHISVDHLIDMVWGEQAPPTAEKTVRTYVYRLRQALARHGDGRQTILTSLHNGYTAKAPEGAIDVDEFIRLTDAARRARRAGAVAEVADCARRGLDLWHGSSALSGIPGAYAQRMRSHLQELRLSALEMSLSAQLSLGIVDSTTAELSHVVAQHPLDERFRSLYMIALYNGHRRADALRTYFEARDVLQEELGIDTGKELQRTYMCILAGDMSSDYPQYCLNP